MEQGTPPVLQESGAVKHREWALVVYDLMNVLRTMAEAHDKGNLQDEELVNVVVALANGLLRRFQNQSPSN